jgi:hypothetical protein
MSEDTKCCRSGTLTTPATSDVMEMLRGTRLGTQERRLLLEAPVWNSFPWHIEPPAPGRSAQESHRRSAGNRRRMGGGTGVVWTRRTLKAKGGRHERRVPAPLGHYRTARRAHSLGGAREPDGRFCRHHGHNCERKREGFEGGPAGDAPPPGWRRRWSASSRSRPLHVMTAPWWAGRRRKLGHRGRRRDAAGRRSPIQPRWWGAHQWRLGACGAEAQAAWWVGADRGDGAAGRPADAGWHAPPHARRRVPHAGGRRRDRGRRHDTGRGLPRGAGTG